MLYRGSIEGLSEAQIDRLGTLGRLVAMLRFGHTSETILSGVVSMPSDDEVRIPDGKGGYTIIDASKLPEYPTQIPA